MNKSIWSIIQRLVIGVVVYFLWQERNLRFFQGKYSSFDDVYQLIRENVRLRLLSSKIRRLKQSFEAAEIWKFHVLQSDVDYVPNPVI